MKIYSLCSLLSLMVLTACSKPSPTPEVIGKFVLASYSGMFEYRIEKVQITDLNCSYREEKYMCVYTEEITGVRKKPNFSAGQWIDVPYHDKSKSRMTLSMGDKGWIKEFW